MKLKLMHPNLLAAAAVASTLAFSAAPVRAATLVVDNVENDGSTTWTTTGGISQFPTWSAAGSGLSPVVGSQFYVFSSKTTNALSGTVRRTEGFGPSFLVSAGTYTLSMSVGEGNIGRRTFSTLEAVLATTGGTEFEGKTVVIPYVDPATPATGEWVTTTVQYVIPSGSALIGQEFTWGFDATKSSGTSYFAAWDAATVDFVPVPEPRAALLGGLGMLALLRRRRH